MESQRNKTLTILENVIFLKKTAMFNKMQTFDLRAIAAIAQEMFIEKGKSVVSENELGDSMFIIKKGFVKVVKRVDDKQTITLAMLKSGDCFGEMALFDAEVRSASVVADDECELLCIHSDDLNDLLLEYPTIAIEFIKTFVLRLRIANQNIRNLSSTKTDV